MPSVIADETWAAAIARTSAGTASTAMGAASAEAQAGAATGAAELLLTVHAAAPSAPTMTKPTTLKVFMDVLLLQAPTAPLRGPRATGDPPRHSRESAIFPGILACSSLRGGEGRTW